MRFFDPPLGSGPGTPQKWGFFDPPRALGPPGDPPNGGFWTPPWDPRDPPGDPLADPLAPGRPGPLGPPENPKKWPFLDPPGGPVYENPCRIQCSAADPCRIGPNLHGSAAEHCILHGFSYTDPRKPPWGGLKTRGRP